MRKPCKEVVKSTTAVWVIQVLKNLDADTAQFKVHSTKSDASSKDSLFGLVC